MMAIEALRAEIPDFAGYDDEDARGKSDEQIRAFVGERLAAIASVDALSPEQRELYDRLLLDCEFMNQKAFHSFETEPPDSQIESVCRADAQLVAIAKRIPQTAGSDLGALFSDLLQCCEQRNAAMQNA